MSRPDFDVGDLVVCVDDGPDKKGKRPKWSYRGQVVRVVELTPPKGEDWSGWGFLADGDPDPALSKSWRACYRFRKIDKADDSFMEMLAACKPKELTR